MERCQHYILQKRRTCNQLARAGTKYCGNHTLEDEAKERKRVPCPYDPTHTILLTDLEVHKFKCPFLQQQQRDQSESYFSANCNAASGAPADLSLGGLSGLPEPPHGSGEAPKQTFAQQLAVRTADRLAFACALGPAALLALIDRIQQAFNQVCISEEPLQQVIPVSAQACLVPDRVRPFSLKHALQQASIVGNMERIGLLQDIQEQVFVEFGAGKGYLSSMLQDCCAARNIVLMDRDSFRLKADRSLRQAEAVKMERIRVDIKDFYVPGLPQLRDGRAPWVALGKHLCGAATDFTLRCCTNALAISGLEDAQGGSTHGKSEDEQPDAGAESLSGGAKEQRGIQGLAVATCCHHRCAWEHYVGQGLFQRLGFTPTEFEMISWMTGWALCGHEAPAGEAKTDSLASGDERADCRAERPEQTSEAFVGQTGQAIAKRKGGGKKRREAADRRRVMSAAASDTQQQDTRASRCNEDTERACTPADEQACGNVAATCKPEAGKDRDAEASSVSACRAKDMEQPGGAAASSEVTGTGVSIAGHERARGAPRGGGLPTPAAGIPRGQRVRVGQMCKRLIDRGRLDFLQEQGFQSDLVLYVPSSVSGENRLLLAVPKRRACSKSHMRERVDCTI